jgi:hypothetical protein
MYASVASYSNVSLLTFHSPVLGWLNWQYYQHCKSMKWPSIAQGKFVQGFGALVQYVKAVGRQSNQSGPYVRPTAHGQT